MEEKKLRGELKKTDKPLGWFIEHRITEEIPRSEGEPILDWFRRNTAEENYKDIPVHPRSKNEYSKYLDMLVEMGRSPNVTYELVSDSGNEYALLKLTESDLFDYTHPDYQLGCYVGEFIVAVHLPTLNVDALSTNRIIDVTEEEVAEYKRLEKAWWSLPYKQRMGKCDEWLAYREYHEELGKKYLDHKLKINVPKFYPKDLAMLKKGIEDTLWDCDRSWYMINGEFFRQTMDGAWCSEIILTLKIKGKFIDE